MGDVFPYNAQMRNTFNSSAVEINVFMLSLTETVLISAVLCCVYAKLYSKHELSVIRSQFMKLRLDLTLLLREIEPETLPRVSLGA